MGNGPDDEDDDDFDKLEIGNLSVVQKLAILGTVITVAAASRGKIKPSVAFRIIKLTAGSALTAGQLSLLQQGGHNAKENAAHPVPSTKLPPLQLGPPPGTKFPNGDLVSPIQSAVIGGSANVAKRAGATGALPAVTADPRRGVLLGRLGTVGRVNPRGVNFALFPGPTRTAVAELTEAVAPPAAMGSFHPALVEAANDAGKRNGDAAKGIGRELIHERADP